MLVFLAGRVFAETTRTPAGRPDAAIDLATKDGVDLVKGQWRYSDTKIIEVDFKAAGVGQTTYRCSEQDIRLRAPRGRSPISTIRNGR